MDIETKKVDDILIVTPNGQNLDVSASTTFRTRFVDLLNEGNKKFILNLSSIKFIDSSGLGALIRTLTLLESNKASIVLCNVSDPVISLFKIARLNHLFMILINEKEAISYYKSQDNIKNEVI